MNYEVHRGFIDDYPNMDWEPMGRRFYLIHKNELVEFTQLEPCPICTAAENNTYEWLTLHHFRTGECVECWRRREEQHA